jgi:hypothetical protein
MKQERLFLIIGIVFVTFGQSMPACAASKKAVADATLTAYELDAVPADQPLDQQPRWRSSLGEIQKAAGTLLETNAKLKTEARQLKSDVDAVQAQIDKQRVKNAQLTDRISQGRGKAQENSDQAQILRLKEILADRGRQIQSQKEMVAAIKARWSSLDSRAALARLRLAELEVDQRSRNVDGKFQDDSALNALGVENQGLRDKIAKGELQAKLLTEKAEELGRLDNPHIPQTRAISAKNAELRKRWLDLQADKDAQQAKFEIVAASKLKVEKDTQVVYVQRLLRDQESLKVRLKENEAKLEALRKNKAGPDLVVSGVSLADMDKLEKQNAVMQEIVENLRENVALLEYKVTTLQRYKDRNKPALQK